MKKIEELSEKYFNGTKVENIKEFETCTPEGNRIKGIICTNHNFHLGSMVITEITWKERDLTFETEQYVQSMPKIHKFNKPMYEEYECLHRAYEKLDGSCLIFYGIYHEDTLIEVVPKTRAVPVATSEMLKKISEIDIVNIEYFFRDYCKSKPVLMFELYGHLNPHQISYPKIRIDINLIAIYLDDIFMDWHFLEYYSENYDFELPKNIFDIYYYAEKWHLCIMPGFFKHYIQDDDISKNIFVAESQEEIINFMTEILDRVNENFYKQHGRDFIEGVVLNAYDETGNTVKMIKVKSTKYLESVHKKKGISIAKRFIKKEVHKYFDEFGENVKKIYQENPIHYKDYIEQNLLEDFSEEEVFNKKTSRRIERVFLDHLNKLEGNDLVSICEKIISENPGLEIKDYMRLLSSEYPEKKKEASTAFGIFKSLL